MTDLPAFETTRIPVDGPGAVKGAMAYLAVVAYPEDTDKRDKFIEACQAWLARIHLRPKERRNLPEWIRKYPTRNVTGPGPLSNGIERLKRSGYAVQVAAALMIPSAFGNNASRITAILESFGDVAHDVPKVRKRIWRPWRPVLHLAIMLNGAMAQQRDVGSGDRLHELIIRPDWPQAALEAAEILRQQFDAAAPFANGNPWPAKLHIPAVGTIRILPA